MAASTEASTPLSACPSSVKIFHSLLSRCHQITTEPSQAIVQALRNQNSYQCWTFMFTNHTCFWNCKCLHLSLSNHSCLVHKCPALNVLIFNSVTDLMLHITASSCSCWCAHFPFSLWLKQQGQSWMSRFAKLTIWLLSHVSYTK